MNPTLSLTPIVNMVVLIAPMAAPRRTFNNGLIIGHSGRLPSYNRLLLVDSGWSAEMIAAGFQTTDPEYLAAQLHFGQTPQPTQAWIGAQVPTAIQTAIPHSGAAGSSYKANDIVLVQQGSAMTVTPANSSVNPYNTFTISGANLTSVINTGSTTEYGTLTISGLTIGAQYVLQFTPTLTSGQMPSLTAGAGVASPTIPALASATVEQVPFIASATSAVFNFTNTLAANWSTATTTCYQATGSLQVLTVNSGAVLTLGKVPGSMGQAYAATSNVITYGGSGTGLAVDIQTIGETPLDAVTANRLASTVWYPCSFAGVSSVGGLNNYPAASDHVAIATYIESATPSSLYMGTSQDPGIPAGVAGNVALQFQAAGYTRSQVEYSSLANDPFGIAMCGMMGVCMGLNTGLANSYFVQMFKQIVGITPETQLSATQVSAIENANGNVYVNRGSYYNIFEKGTMGNGGFFDTKLFTDMLASNIQLNVMDLFYGTPEVPQTDLGVGEIIHAVNQACQQGVSIGYISPNGTFNGLQPVLNLAPGNPMPTGYVTQAPRVSTLTPAQVSARQSPSIYCTINFTNGIQSVTIEVVVSNS